MRNCPDRLREFLDAWRLITDETERTSALISYADRFKEVPPEVAQRPFPKEHQVPFCESEAYVWAIVKPDRTVQLYFAVENPSGISAKALAVILDRTLSGTPPEHLVDVTPDVVETIFRQNISMGKGMGLMSMVQTVRRFASQACTQHPFQSALEDKTHP
jgi:cysteine desulfuration protein SufE